MRPRTPRSIRRLQQLGLLQGLGIEEAWRIYDAVGRTAPASALLRLYCAADGDAVESLWRRQRDRYVEALTSEPAGALATALLHALPAIGPLKMKLTPEALIISNERHTVTVSQVVRHSRVKTRVRRVALRSPRHIVRAVNALLSYDDQPRRFVELVGEPGRHAFLAVDAAAGRGLLDLRATVHRDISDMYAFAGWDRGPSVAAVG